MWGEIYVTGNTIIGTLDMYFNRVKDVEQNILEKIRFDSYALATFHRSENADNPKSSKFH